MRRENSPITKGGHRRIPPLLLFCWALGGCDGVLPVASSSVSLRERCQAEASIVPAAASAVIDGDESTGYRSNHFNWQNVIVDLGCEVRISGLRRKMSGSGTRRGLQGEGFALSQDGRTWTTITGDATSGWNAYTNYRPHAWHSVDYGWSRWLRLRNPIHARLLRFSWDGNGDSLDELEVDSRVASASANGIAGGPDNVLDGDLRTAFLSSRRGWQYLDVDLGQAVPLTAIRRHMSGGAVGPNRGLKGEFWEVSEDGSSWTRLTAVMTEGWEAYINYVPHAWHSVEYGWSDWLTLKLPMRVRRVRFHWDGAGDQVNELEFSQAMMSRDPNYDFDLYDASRRVDPREWPVGPMRPTAAPPFIIGRWPTTPYDLGSRIGVTGMYDGWVSPQSTVPLGYCSGGLGRVCGGVGHCPTGEVCLLIPGTPPPPPNVSAPRGRVRASLNLVEASGEARGYLRINEPGMVYDGGTLCGQTGLEVGTEVPVRMISTVSDGQFAGRLSSLRAFPGPFNQQFFSGRTSRFVDRFLFSGTVQARFDAAVDIKQHQAVGQGGFRTGTHLYGSLLLEMPAPCPSAHLGLTFERYDQSLMLGLGW